jgi:hypothetical protein
MLNEKNETSKVFFLIKKLLAEGEDVYENSAWAHPVDLKT